MSIFDKGLLFIYSLILTIVSGVVLLYTFGLAYPMKLLSHLFYYPYTNNVITLIVAFILLSSLWFIVLSLRSNSKNVNAVVQDTELGQVRISINALENIVNRVTYQIKGVKEVKPKIFEANNGIGIFVEVLVAPDLNIPNMTKEIQNEIRDYLDEIVGLKVNNIRIFVQNISTEVKGRVE